MSRTIVKYSNSPKWHVIKTKPTCRFGESGIGRTSSGWKFPELTSLRSVGSGARWVRETSSHPRCVQSRTHRTCKYVCYRIQWFNLRIQWFNRETSSHPRCVQSRTHLPASMFVIGFNDSILGFNDSILGFNDSILGFNDSI
jgi:hypothetical protein